MGHISCLNWFLTGLDRPPRVPDVHAATCEIRKMFVPKATARNPRRRQRTGSDDSVKPPKAKRQRSVLRQTEGSPPDVSLSRDHGHELAAPARPNDHDDVTGDRMAAESHLPIRNTKPSEGLAHDIEGTVVLVSGPFSLTAATLECQSRLLMPFKNNSQAQIITQWINYRPYRTKSEAPK